MKKSTKVRFIIFEILIEIYKKNLNFDKFFDLKKFIKKKLKTSQYILFASAITQIVFLNVKPYAVVNETVEVAKKIDLYPSFINAVLKQIVKNSEILKNIQIEKNDLPSWFQNEIEETKGMNFSIFLNSYFNEPSLHIVFKSINYLDKFNEEYELSSLKSVFVKSRKKVFELSNYKDGYWWVQNFSSMLPVILNPNLKGKSILDLCAAPGGKAFQIMSENDSIVLNDVSKKRIQTLNENLLRLNYSAKIENYDALNFPENKKYDVVMLDSPCSSVGTVRKNPEILFRNQGPNFKFLFELQEKLLNKSSKLLNPNGIIVYMVCSFLYSETIKPIEKFLEKNKNFSILKYNYIPKELKINSLINQEGYFLTAPTIYEGYKIDGFFSIQLIKNAQ